MKVGSLTGKVNLRTIAHGPITCVDRDRPSSCHAVYARTGTSFPIQSARLRHDALSSNRLKQTGALAAPHLGSL